MTLNRRYVYLRNKKKEGDQKCSRALVFLTSRLVSLSHSRRTLSPLSHLTVHSHCQHRFGRGGGPGAGHGALPEPHGPDHIAPPIHLELYLAGPSPATGRAGRPFGRFGFGARRRGRGPRSVAALQPKRPINVPSREHCRHYYY